jgi:methylenetetrahydrofolate reductase (NADPH)
MPSAYATQNEPAARRAPHSTGIVQVSFEFFPPKTAAAEQAIWPAARRLGELRPVYCSLTYGASGSGRSYSLDFLNRLQCTTQSPVAAHLTCVGASRGEVDDIARRYWEAGIRHIVALRGDSPDANGKFEPHPQGYKNAAELVAGLKRLADFEISVAAYPEIHPESPSSKADLDNLKRKIDAGATRAITQFFFDTEAFPRFYERARMHGVDIPIVPGILASPNFASIHRMARRCGTSIPAWLMHLFEGIDDQPELRKFVATNVAIEQCRRLYDYGVREFHFYTLNQSELTFAVCHLLGMRPTRRVIHEPAY